MEHLTCEERLRKLGLFRMEKKQLQGDLTAACQYLGVGFQEDGSGLFTVVYGMRARNNGHKL